jgi:hypothetical protein
MDEKTQILLGVGLLGFAAYFFFKPEKNTVTTNNAPANQSDFGLSEYFKNNPLQLQVDSITKINREDLPLQGINGFSKII